jgi:hypothetical protein
MSESGTGKDSKDAKGRRKYLGSGREVAEKNDLKFQYVM